MSIYSPVVITIIVIFIFFIVSQRWLTVGLAKRCLRRFKLTLLQIEFGSKATSKAEGAIL